MNAAAFWADTVYGTAFLKDEIRLAFRNVFRNGFLLNGFHFLFLHGLGLRHGPIEMSAVFDRFDPNRCQPPMSQLHGN